MNQGFRWSLAGILLFHVVLTDDTMWYSAGICASLNGPRWFPQTANALAGMAERLSSVSFFPCSLKASSSLHVVFPVGQ